MTIETALDRIKKLLAHSESARGLGSVAEAEAFAAKAADIALQHKLSLDAIEFADEEAADPIGKELVNTAELKGDKRTRNRSAWQQELLAVLARNNSCRIVVMTGSKTCYLIGSSADREIVKYLYAVLAREAERLARRGGWSKRDFLLGFVRGVSEKLYAQRKSTLAEAGSTALVRVEQHDLAVERWMRESLNLRASAGLGGARDGASYHAGKAAGANANLNGGLAGGTVSRASSMRLTA